MGVMGEWAKEHHVTLYALSIDDGLLGEFGLDVEHVACGSSVPGWRSNTLALMAAVRGMGRRLGDHDLYFMNLFPTHLVDRHPNVWYPHEPARMLYDLYPEMLAREDIPAHSKLLTRAYFPLLRRLDRGLFRADKVVANSRYCSTYLKGIYGVESRVVYNGVSVVGKPRYGGDYVLSVSRLAGEKRVDAVVKAMKQVKGITLKVAGEGPEENRLRGMAGGNVEFLGRVEESGMHDLYANALCTVYVPLREPFGRIPLESMAAGTPVIGCREGGFTEVVEDGVDCFLVDPTPENIAGRINYLRDNPGVCAEMGRRGYAKAQGYTWEKTARQLLEQAR